MGVSQKYSNHLVNLQWARQINSTDLCKCENQNKAIINGQAKGNSEYKIFLVELFSLWDHSSISSACFWLF